MGAEWPSALNQQLIHLEKDLGTKLFQRDNRNLWPTQAGKIYLENAKEILKIKKIPIPSCRTWQTPRLENCVWA